MVSLSTNHNDERKRNVKGLVRYPAPCWPILAVCAVQYHKRRRYAMFLSRTSPSEGHTDLSCTLLGDTIFSQPSRHVLRTQLSSMVYHCPMSHKMYKKKCPNALHMNLALPLSTTVSEGTALATPRSTRREALADTFSPNRVIQNFKHILCRYIAVCSASAFCVVATSISGG